VSGDVRNRRKEKGMNNKMEKRFLLGIYAFFLSLSAIGQTSYYVAEETIISIVDNKKLDMSYGNNEYRNDTKFKYELKYSADGYSRFYAGYYWDGPFIEKPNSEEYEYVSGWMGIFKYEYIRANESDFGLQVFYKWNYNTNDWEVEKKIERNRDSNNREIFTIQWEKEGEKWIPSHKEEHEYVKNKKIYTEYIWKSEIENLMPQYKHEDEYNAKGERVLWTSYNWDKLQNCWRLRSKAEFNYNAKGQLIRQVNYIPKDSIWIRSSKTEVAKYDKSGKEELCIFYDWNENTRKWIEKGRNDSKKEKEKINPNEKKHWDDSLNVWIDNVRADCQYDELGREILSVFYEWNSTEKKWRQASKKEIEYDDNNNPIFIRIHTWQQEEWVFSESRESRYEKNE
jgi:hypothetical protein